jgi:hypothetical protein
MNTTRLPKGFCFSDLVVIISLALVLIVSTPAAIGKSPWMHKHAKTGVANTLVAAALDTSHSLTAPVSHWWVQRENDPGLSGRAGNKIGQALTDNLTQAICSNSPSC